MDRDGYLRLIVDDDGMGIPPQLCDRLLERGERADPSTPGHGLGLAIVRSVVSTYGGELTIGHSLWGGASISLRFRT
jgi:two-component system sensor histidine kinase PhoQ